jgi:hypothetical protein
MVDAGEVSSWDDLEVMEVMLGPLPHEAAPAVKRAVEEFWMQALRDVLCTNRTVLLFSAQEVCLLFRHKGFNIDPDPKGLINLFAELVSKKKLMRFDEEATSYSFGGLLYSSLIAMFETFGITSAREPAEKLGLELSDYLYFSDVLEQRTKQFRSVLNLSSSSALSESILSESELKKKFLTLVDSPYYKRRKMQVIDLEFQLVISSLLDTGGALRISEDWIKIKPDSESDHELSSLDLAVVSLKNAIHVCQTQLDS